MFFIPIAAILVACLSLSNAAAPFAENGSNSVTGATINYRLPLIIKAINYNIIIKPYLNESDSKKFTFDGECYIEIQASQNTKEIQLHMKNLNIFEREYYEKNSSMKTDLPDVKPNNLTNIVIYKLSKELQANVSYILHYKYTGIMDEDMHGFYRSSYTTSKNVTKWLGSTQFETHHARRVFPCFDEPKFKATFDLSLIRHRSLRSIGPTNIVDSKLDGEYITDIYNTTPIMSTYILAFIVSDFNDRFDGQFGVLARPEYYSQTEYSFDVGKEILNALGDYLGIPYYSMGIDKMHMAAIPDFSAGAMENWGLLTYRERALLYDEDHSSLSSKEYIAAVVAHEQAHMWFGDLVTCDWWSYTWLNEGFARYFQYHATDLVESYFDMPKQFVVDQIQSVMGMDATNATNPMSDENTNTPADLGRMFNSISYNKGAAFISMTKHILGENKFKNSLNEYLQTHKYANTIPSDLFTIWKNKYWPIEFMKYADKYFASFTTQVGYPMVTFNRTSDTNVIVSQKRFLLKDFEKVDRNLVYTVPITYTTNVQKEFGITFPVFFLDMTPQNIPISSATKWIIGNIQETGYYRVNYDIKSWHKIHEALSADNWSGIPESNRAQIIDDLLNFARAGEIDYGLAFDIIAYLKTEINYLPWTSAFNGLNYLSIRLGTEMQDFSRYILHITATAYNKLGFEEMQSDTALDIYTRNKILAWSCKFGKSDCISKAKSYFKENLKAYPVPVNIRSVVYCTAMREGSEQDFNKLYKKYKTETVPTEETLILSTLGCVKNITLVTRLFHMIMSTEIRRQDKSSALFSLYTENNENVEPVFDLIDQNVEQFSEALGDYSSVASVIANIAARFTSEAQLGKLKTFNTKHKHKFGSSISTLDSAIKTVEFNLNWSKVNLASVRKGFQKYGKSSAAYQSTSLLTLIFVLLVIPIFNYNNSTI